MIVIHEIPYQVNKARLVEKIAELVRDRRIEGISDLRDESDRKGMRVVIELKKDVLASIVLNQLYKHTPLQSSFGVNTVALVNGQPRLLDLRQLLENFLIHRKEIVTRRTIFELRKAEAESHILEGLKIALDQIDAIIGLIKKSKSPQEAKGGPRFSLWTDSDSGPSHFRHAISQVNGLGKRKNSKRLYGTSRSH